MKNKILYIDFDGVIHKFRKGWEGDIPTNTPVKHTKWALNKLKAEGYEIVVFTTRKDHNAVEDYLMHNTIPFDRITSQKGVALAYIDDRGIRFTDWEDIVKYFV